MPPPAPSPRTSAIGRDRKSTRLNSSHGYISYAVFCLKKKKNKRHVRRQGLTLVSSHIRTAGRSSHIDLARATTQQTLTMCLLDTASAVTAHSDDSETR